MPTYSSNTDRGILVDSRAPALFQDEHRQYHGSNIVWCKQGRRRDKGDRRPFSIQEYPDVYFRRELGQTTCQPVTGDSVSLADRRKQGRDFRICDIWYWWWGSSSPGCAGRWLKVTSVSSSA